MGRGMREYYHTQILTAIPKIDKAVSAFCFMGRWNDRAKCGMGSITA